VFDDESEKRILLVGLTELPIWLNI